ncbi:hypothetical protein T492DRAFT_1085679 [Pavlovales sp. CCMP2436]|nr:hypothetical protein T492DRAFT_1085679 [Pavlovales sp. CCMP2436]
MQLGHRLRVHIVATSCRGLVESAAEHEVSARVGRLDGFARLAQHDESAAAVGCADDLVALVEEEEFGAGVGRADDLALLQEGKGAALVGGGRLRGHVRDERSDLAGRGLDELELGVGAREQVLGVRRGERGLGELEYAVEARRGLQGLVRGIIGGRQRGQRERLERVVGERSAATLVLPSAYAPGRLRDRQRGQRERLERVVGERGAAALVLPSACAPGRFRDLSGGGSEERRGGGRRLVLRRLLGDARQEAHARAAALELRVGEV